MNNRYVQSLCLCVLLFASMSCRILFPVGRSIKNAVQEWPDLPRYAFVENEEVRVYEKGDEKQHLSIRGNLEGDIVFSPDGDRYAYLSSEQSDGSSDSSDNKINYTVFVHQISSGDLSGIQAGTEGNVLVVGFSPDSKKLMVHWGSFDHNRITIYCIGEDCFEEGPNLEYPDWNPVDDRLIAGTRWAIPGGSSFTVEFGIFRMDGTPVAILDDEQNIARFAWSPDGERLAYLKDSTIWVANKDGTNQHYVTAVENMHYMKWKWSPSGKYLAFSYWVHRTDNTNDLQIAYVDTWSVDGPLYQMGLGYDTVWLTDDVMVVERGDVSWHTYLEVVKNDNSYVYLTTDLGSHNPVMVPSP